MSSKAPPLSGNALPHEVEPRLLARENTVLEGTLALSEFARMSESLRSDVGEVEVNLAFRLDRSDRVVIKGHLRTRVVMECQHCLEDMEVEIDAAVDVVASRSEDQVRELTETREALLLPADRVPLTALIEDDLILSLPMVPSHGTGRCIESLGYRAEESRDDHPFAVLARLKEGHEGEGPR